MAAGRISGITIEIAGDTTKLTDSLKAVDKELKTTESNLKDINKLLKFDGSNVQLLTQKQQALKDAIGLTKDRLEELKQAQSQVGKGTAEYDALEREIAETEQKLAGLKSEYSSFGSVAASVIKDVGGKMQELGGKISDVGETLTKNVTAPIAAVAGASAVAWKEVDSAMDSLIVKTGASGERLAEMEGIVNSLATTMPVTFDEAAQAVGEVATRFDVTGEELQNLSAAFLQYAKINNVDVSSAIDAVSASMKAYGVDSSRTGEVLDVLTAVSQQTGVSVDSLASLMQTAAPLTRELGMSFEEAAFFLGELDKNGIDASSVVTGLKTALKNATADGKTMSEALAEMQDSLKNASSDTEALQIATELFGAKAAPAMLQAIRDGRIDLTDFSADLTGVAGSVTETFAATQDPIDALQANMNNLKLVGADLVNTAAPAISAAMEGLGNIIQRLSDWWGSLSEEEQQQILTIAGVVAAVGPVLMVIGKVVSGIGGVVSALSFLASPVGLVIAAIAAVIAIGVALYKHWDDIKAAAAAVGEWVSEKWNAMKEGVVNAWNAVKDAATTVSNWVSDKWNAAKEKVSGALSSLKEKASQTWSNIKESAREKTEAMKEALQSRWDAIKSSYEAHGGGLKGVAGAMMDSIKSSWSAGYEALNKLTGGKLDAVKQKFTDIFDKVKSVVSGAIEKIKGVFNFKWSLPSLKLPHISVKGGVAPFGIGGKGSLPSFSIQWYKKAYDNAIMFQNPTVIPTMTGYKGFGDGSGAEIVMGLNKLQELVGASSDIVVNVYGSQGMDVNELADAVQARLVALQRQREAAYA